MNAEPPRAFPSFATAVRVWARIGCLSFGGPAGQIALMHREIVETRRWVSDARFLHALNFCTLLPGPEAQQLATYLGWLLHGVRGGLAAGLLFVLPGAAVMLALSAIYLAFGTLPAVAALFFGLQCAVLVLVLDALLRVARRALQGRLAWLVAGLAFLALFVLAAPFPLVVLAAAALGYARPDAFVGARHGTARDGPPALLDALLLAEPDRIARLGVAARRAGVAALILWALPVLALTLVGGAFADIAWFFSKMAVVTFGGAYAVLAYVAQQAVEGYGWLSAAEMLAGLGLAETTPGPLILVLQFVGTLAGARAAGTGTAGTGMAGTGTAGTGEADALGGLLGALLTLWVTFAPCFAFIFLGAPFVERLHDETRLKGALAGVTAAVVGVIANLALWFGLRVLFGDIRAVPVGPVAIDLPVPASLDPVALALAALAALCLFGLRLGVVRTLAATAAAGLVLRLALPWALS